MTVGRRGSGCLLALALGSGTVRAQDLKPLLDKLAEKGVLTETERREMERALGERPSPLPLALKTGGQIQVRLAAQRNHALGKEKEDSFRIRRAKFSFDGTLVEDVDFKLELDASREAALEDAEIRWQRWPQAEATLGQFKTPFSLENMQSDKRLDMIERAEAVKALSPDRDIGIALRGRFLESRLGYRAAMVNGNGKNKKINDDDHFLWMLRLEGGPVRELRLGHAALDVDLGAGVAASSDSEARVDEIFGVKKALGTLSSGRRLLWGADLAARAGRASLKAEWLQGEFRPVNRALRPIVAQGYYVQGGYFLASRLQALARYETYDPDRHASNESDLRWTTLGANCFLRGHELRLQVNYLFKEEDGSGVDDDAFMTMLQLLF